MQSIWLYFGALLLGALLLYHGAEWLVRGAAGMALRLGVRPLLIGLTVVSYATSAPELIVSVRAALGGNSEIALGNVVGSNVANIGLILGLTALIAPPRTDGSMAGRELWVLAASTAVLPLLLWNQSIERLEGLVLLAGALGFTWLTLRWSKARPPELEELPDTENHGSVKLVGIGLGGLLVLILGGEIFVVGAVRFAEHFGVSTRIIGLTIVAVGTSLPELAASLVAALRGHSELAIGNVIGSNIFNLLLILGVASVVRPIGGSLGAMRLDLAMLGVSTAFLLIALRKPRTLSRLEGGILTGGYCGFLVALGVAALG